MAWTCQHSSPYVCEKSYMGLGGIGKKLVYLQLLKGVGIRDCHRTLVSKTGFKEYMNPESIMVPLPLVEQIQLHHVVDGRFSVAGKTITFTANGIVVILGLTNNGQRIDSQSDGSDCRLMRLLPKKQRTHRKNIIAAMRYLADSDDDQDIQDFVGLWIVYLCNILAANYWLCFKLVIGCAWLPDSQDE